MRGPVPELASQPYYPTAAESNGLRRDGSGGCACACDLVLALGELLDDLGAERRQVVGIARGDQTLVHHDLLVDPRAAGVPDVGPQAREGGQRAIAHEIGLDQRPRTVADDPGGPAR